MTRWPEVALGDVATIERDIIEPSKIQAGTLYVGLENIKSGGDLIDVRPVDAGELASSKFAFSPLHVLYGKLRPYLAKIARPDFIGICSTDILPILPGKELDRGYLAHFLLTPRMVTLASSLASGANLPRLSPQALSKLRIPLPPLEKQRRIAEVLDRAEALRAKRRAALAQLDTLAHAIFLDMFGDPTVDTKKWQRREFGDVVAEMQYGPRFYNESYDEDGVRIVRITDLNDMGELDFDSMPRMNVSDEDRAKYQLRVGDLIFARTGATVGKVALIRDVDPPCIAGAYFINIRFTDSVLPDFALGVLSASSIQKRIEVQSRQSAQQNFSGPGLRRLPMPLPPLALQSEFAAKRAAIARLRATQRRALHEHDELFSALQERAFRGDV